MGGYVTFKNAAVGEIGSTYIVPPTQAPVPAPTPTLHHRLVVDVIQITIKIALLVVQSMHLAIMYGYPMVLKIIASPYGVTVPDRVVVDLLNVLAMVTLLHVFHLQMLHPLQLLHQVRLAVQRVSLVKKVKIAAKRSARRENAKNKIICILQFS